MEVLRQKKTFSKCVFLCIVLVLFLVFFSDPMQKESIVYASESMKTRDTFILCRHDIEYISWRIWSDYLEEKRIEEEQREKELDKWRLVLVNFEYPLEEDYKVKRTEVKNHQYVDKRIADDLNNMLNAARKDGIDIQVVSGYRSFKRQTTLYNQKIRRLKRQGYTEEEAIKEAGTVVAVPGSSEHMTGLAVDLTTAEDPRLEEFQEDTECYQWLVKHCMEFGFIVRYPEGKSDITGIIYEPWHFRYVGKKHARMIMENGWCLEEYLRNYLR